jgi:hypothetical protein
MAANLVKFVYAASATPEQIAAFDSNTIYFIGNPRQIYKGSTLYDGGAANVAADLATLESYIGTLPVSGDYTDLIDYIDKSIAAGDETVMNAVTTLDNSLAAVAKSGAAADVSVADTAGKLDSTNVEAALAELVSKIESGGEAGAVTVTKTVGGANDSFVSKYTFSQGGTPITNGEIEIGKDLVATNGQLVNQDGEGNSGTFIKMTIANGTPFYINVADLIEYNSVESTDEITLTDTNHKITATVGEIAASKIIYQAAQDSTPAKTVAQAINALESAVGSGGSVDQKIADAIAELDSSATATAGSAPTSVTMTDGKITASTEVALTADNITYGSGTAKAALDTIGTIPATSTATTVVGYVDEKIGAGVSALDADVDAALGAGDTDAEAVAVVTGVTEVDGVITGVDSVVADKAGAATRAKAAIIGQAGELASADTIHGAKQYADDAVAAALSDVNDDITALDADLDASGTAQHAGVFVMSGVTQVDGKLTAVDSVEVDAAGAAATAEQNAKDYADGLLTWGSLA